MKNKSRAFYFVGVKGVGMASLAVIAKQAKFAVSGSDIHQEYITDTELKNEHISFFSNFDPNHIDQFVQRNANKEIFVIYTGAHGGKSNPEAARAAEKGLNAMTHGRAAGLFMEGSILGKSNQKGISVSGTHGKTTTSAMLATCFHSFGLDPSYAVGTSEIFPLGSAGHFGKGKYFIAEADEYASDIRFDRTAKFLYQNPETIIVNNIDFDHPDFFHDIDEVNGVFISFVKKLSANGLLVVNGEDDRAKSLKQAAGRNISFVTFGSNPENTFYVSKFYQENYDSYFSVESKDVYLGDFRLSVPGFHNVKNALAVIAACCEYGYTIAEIRNGIQSFKGTKRRIEYKGETANGSIVIDDYAHHPREIKATLSTIRHMFPKKKILCVFQPHTYSRTQALLPEFTSSFFDCDQLLLLPVYASLREAEVNPGYSEAIFNEFRKRKTNTFFLKNDQNVIEYLNNTAKNEDYVIVTMGAGEVYKLAESVSKR